MNSIIEEILALDKTLHEPARIVILTLLSVVEKTDFLFLKNNTGLTQGNLSSHLSKLETAGFIKIEKTYKGKRPLTLVQLSETGKKEFEKYLVTLKNYINEINLS